MDNLRLWIRLPLYVCCIWIIILLFLYWASNEGYCPHLLVILVSGFGGGWTLDVIRNQIKKG